MQQNAVDPKLHSQVTLKLIFTLLSSPTVTVCCIKMLFPTEI